MIGILKYHLGTLFIYDEEARCPQLRTNCVTRKTEIKKHI